MSLSRRSFLKLAASAAGVIGAGAIGGVAWQRAHRTPFEKILDEVGDRYELYDAKDCGGRLIFYLMEVHEAAAEKENQERLDYLVNQFHVPFVGIEGIADRPDTKAEIDASKTVETMLTTDARELADGKGVVHAAYAEVGKGHFDAFDNKKFQTLGLEDPENLVDLKLMGAIRGWYDQLQATILMNDSDAIFEIDGKPLVHLYAFRKCSEHFKADPDFPQFDFSKLQTTSNEGKTYRYLPAFEKAYTSEFVEKLDNWLSKMCIDPRTTYASKKIMDAMEKKDYKVAALLFGGAHAVRPTNFQSEFAKRGFSYIVLNLPANDWGIHYTPRIKK